MLSTDARPCRGGAVMVAPMLALSVVVTLARRGRAARCDGCCSMLATMLIVRRSPRSVLYGDDKLSPIRGKRYVPVRCEGACGAEASRDLV